jgi:hypothetical protein
LVRIVTAHVLEFFPGHVIRAVWNSATVVTRFVSGPVSHCAVWQHCLCFLLQMYCCPSVRLVVSVRARYSFRHGTPGS